MRRLPPGFGVLALAVASAAGSAWPGQQLADLGGRGVPRLLAAGDLNADGRADLGVAVAGAAETGGADRLVLLLSGPGGHAPVTIDFADPIAAVAIGDTDHDGLDDLIVLDAERRLRVYRQTPAGTLIPPPGVNLLPGPTLTPEQCQIRVVDLDADGVTEVCVFAPEFQPVQNLCLLSDFTDGLVGAVSFRTAPPLSAGMTFELVDLNADGVLDQLWIEDGVVVYSLAVDGDYPVNRTFSAGAGTVFFADLDADALPEVCRAFDGILHVERLSRDEPPLVLPFTGLPLAAVLPADLDADGMTDTIVRTNEAVPRLMAMTAINPGPCEKASAFPLAPGPASWLLADLDANGRDDLVLVIGGVVTVYHAFEPGPGTPVLRGVAPDGLDGFSPAGVLAADLNADGLADLALGSDAGEGRVLFQTAPGVLGPPVTLGTGDAGRRPVTGDWNGDARADLAWSPAGATVPVQLGGPGGLSPTLRHTLPGPVRDLVALRVNPARDSLLTASGSAVRRLGMVGSALVTEQTLSTPAAPLRLAAADVDRDGTPDAVFAASAGRVYGARNAGGTLHAPTLLAQIAGPGWDAPRALIAHDLDADGADDLALLDDAGERLAVLWGGPGGFVVQEMTVGPGAVGLHAGDLDGDGKAELVLALDAHGGGNGGAEGGGGVVVLGLSSGRVFAETARLPGPHTRGVATADFNADGALDLAIAAGPGPVPVRVLLSAGAGGPPPCPADFTGDGAADVFDLLIYLDLYAAGADGADLAAPAGVDVFDLLRFMDLYQAGCP